MYNKVNVPNQKYQLIKLAMILLLLTMAMAVIVLFTYRALETRNYNGHVKEVSGVVTSVVHSEDDTEIKLDNGVAYNANRIRNCYPNFDLNSLKNKQVTFYLPEKQMGVSPEPWVIGIKQGDETLIDYHEVIADGKAEAKLSMIVSGIVAGVLGAIVIGLFVWRLKINPLKEVDLYKAYCEFTRQRQPSCPQYKYLNVAAIIYLVVMLIMCILVAVVCSLVEALAVQLAVAVAMCAVFIGCTVGLFVVANKLAKKEREFYSQNFPFDLDDISHLAVYGKQKQHKARMQAELNEERKNFPHRYHDAGNGYVVDFTENGVAFFDEEASFSTPGADFVFGEGGEMPETAQCIFKIDYQNLNFEALPYYRKKDHPLTVIIKSRIADNSGLPEEMVNDLHVILDSNLLATLHRFDVPVENLQHILDNKEQLIKENCEGRKKN